MRSASCGASPTDSVAIEAVGSPATFELATQLVRPGGRVANIGLRGTPSTLHLESLWSRDVTITTGLADTSSIPVLSRLLEGRQIDAARFATHHLELAQMVEAYRISSDAASTGASEVVLAATS